MIGTIANAAGILLGGIIGLTRKRALPATSEAFFKVALGAFTVFYGLRLTWLSLNGSWTQILKQLLIVVLALMVGKLTGHLLHLQKLSNRIGRDARDRMAAATPENPRRASEGFKTCAALFCAAPLGILGAIQDGLSGYFYPLIVKGFIDGLATRGFVPLFGWGVLLSVIPVLAIQGSITLLSYYFLAPYLRAHGLIDPINAVGGLLVFCVAMVVLDIKKFALADYLPSLAFAPLLTSLLK
jgi:uncharacterized membrane protein YqgA involved in biofilm formation